MNRQEQRELDEELLRIYGGILFNAPNFRKGEPKQSSFDFKNATYSAIKAEFQIEKVAGRGTDFDRALRLNRHLAKHLTHKGDYALSQEGRTVPFDALSLLRYSFGRPDHGINCAAKSLILQACCLALGIYARRVGLYPASPYDCDNHIVCEIFDRARRAWIMLDPTTGGYVSDGERPLSVLEMREDFSKNAHISVVFSRQNPKNIDALMERNHAINAYYAKNLFYLSVVLGKDLGCAYLVPEGFDLRRRNEQYATYMLETARAQGMDADAIAHLEKWKREAASEEFPLGDLSLWSPPAFAHTS